MDGEVKGAHDRPRSDGLPDDLPLRLVALARAGFLTSGEVQEMLSRLQARRTGPETREPVG